MRAAGRTQLPVFRPYGASDKPIGQEVCFGSRADIAHQMVQQLRSGKYTTDGAASAAFTKVVPAGHSGGQHHCAG